MHDWVQTSAGWMCNRCGQHGGNGTVPATTSGEECRFADGCCGDAPEEDEEVKPSTPGS